MPVLRIRYRYNEKEQLIEGRGYIGEEGNQGREADIYN